MTAVHHAGLGTMVGDPPSKPTASWIAVELRVADRVAGGEDCSSGVEIVSAWKRCLDVPRGCGLMDRGLGAWIRFGAVACAVEVVVDIKIMDGREKMTEPKPAAKKRQGAKFESSWHSWQLPEPSHSSYIVACIYATSMGCCRVLTVLWISSWQLFACAVKLPRCLTASLSNSLMLDKRRSFSRS
jgi:hypothetical protein